MFRSRFLKAMLLSLGILLLVALSSQAGNIPQLINYNGVLTDNAGTPVPDGEYDVGFNIYDASTGGNILWAEVWDINTTKVVVLGGGNFNAMLGAHNPIPTSFFADHPVAYLGVTVGSDSEMLPRQRITSVGYAFSAGNGVPAGGIIMWSGAVVDIPEGWSLCDGTNGTPDLLDRFVVGAGGGYAVNSTGGTSSISLAHSHTVSSHTHSIAHTHTYSGNTSTGDYNVNRTRDNSLYNTAGDTHKHNYSGTTSTGSNANSGGSAPGTNSQLSATQSILPPYFALAFIMKL